MSRNGKMNERSFSYPHLRKYQLMILILQLVNRQSINRIAILRQG